MWKKSVRLALETHLRNTKIFAGGNSKDSPYL